MNLCLQPLRPLYMVTMNLTTSCIAWESCSTLRNHNGFPLRHANLGLESQVSVAAAIPAPAADDDSQSKAKRRDNSACTKVLFESTHQTNVKRPQNGAIRRLASF